MKKTMFMLGKENDDQGSVTVVALVMLMVLTLLGIAASRTSTTDIRIAANEIPFKENFFIAQGGVNREMVETGAANYPVLYIYSAQQVAYQDDNDGQQSDGSELPAPRPHEVNGTRYEFQLWYEGYYPPPVGWSPLDFIRHDWSARDVFATGERVQIDSRFYTIGPKL